ncbi:MAG: tetratricopeptide repeat protein [Ancalomicrobiaceae bacterium]|nr:tetratricopeptide repeat protein [Ancalomicrobiaceae bacterium]
MSDKATEAVEATPEEAVAYAVAALRAGKLAVAENVFAQVLAAFPDHPDALHFSGLMRAQQGKSDEAIALVRRSLDVAPHNPSAWNNLANLLVSANDFDRARDAYLKCLDLAPDFPDALANVGLMLRELGDVDTAEALYRRALDIRPDFAEALNNLATILVARGEAAAAVDLLKRAIELEPRFGDAYTNLGTAYRSLGAREAAAECGWKALALRHGDKVARKFLIYALIETGERDKAIEVARDWLALSPDDPDARHHHAAVTGENVPDRCADAYVETVFDKFAASFDAALSHLGYRAPEFCADALKARIGEPAGRLDILDAGCGTGLAAPFLKPFARHLAGIDLSRGMLAKAEARGLYDALAKAEITAAMLTSPKAYDVVLSADTLCYFGDLNAVMAAAAHALRPGGVLVVSVEALDADDGRPFRLHEGSGRYAHTKAHVEAAATAAGLADIGCVAVDLRMEGGRPVAGLVVTARID